MTRSRLAAFCIGLIKDADERNITELHQLNDYVGNRFVEHAAVPLLHLRA